MTRKEDTQMTTTNHVWQITYNVDTDRRALELKKGFGFAYTFLTERRGV